MQELKSHSLWENVGKVRPTRACRVSSSASSSPEAYKKTCIFVSSQRHGGGMRAAGGRSDVASATGKRTEFQDRGAGRAS